MKTPVILIAALALAAPQEPPVLRVTSRLVQVNVIVQDRRGEPVAGLSADDFVLIEEGRPQKVRLFSVESLQPLAPAEPAGGGPRNIFSNHPARRGGAPNSVTVILFDGLNMRFQDQAYAKAQIIKFLRQLKPEDRLAIYTLGTSLRILHDFTNDTATLLRALERHRAGDSAELSASNPEEPDTGIEELDEFLREGNQKIADFYTIQRAERTLQAIEAIAKHLYRVPGRKNLIWVSGGFPLTMGMDSMEPNSTAERRTFGPEVERATRAVNSANLAIYPVDARGLIGVFDTNPELNPGSRSRPAVGSAPRRDAARRIAETHDTMQELAERTGGRAFYNTNDIRGAIRQAVDDSRVTYILGYYPAHEKWDGRFREIKVRVKRSGLRVRHRSGYFALPEEGMDSGRRKAALAAAAAGPLDATTLGVTVKITAPDPARPRSLKLEIGLQSAEIRLDQRDGQWLGELDLVFIQRSVEGASLAAVSETARLQFARSTYEQVMQRGMVVNGQMDLVAGAQQLRIVVRDAGSGSTGSVSIPLSQFAPESR